MATIWNGWYWRLGLASLLAMGGVIAANSDCVLAQVTPDVTLGAESSVVTPTNNNGIPSEQIDGGATRGANLFHSFDEFSVPTGGEAFFNNALDIQNIISRVTGGSISNIDGLLRANGTANLFLLNPNGIIFGPNASLNIGGSFMGSTASSLNFADGIQFSATASQTTPLLTISVPIGLQYGGTAGSILNQSQATNSSGQRVGLQVLPGKTLSLVGGDVRLDGGRLEALGGRVELGGLAGAGTVGLSVDSNNLLVSFPDGVARADVYLTNRALIDVATSNGGSIAITARNIDILGQSIVRGGIDDKAGFLGAQAGDIELRAQGEINMAGPNDTNANNNTLITNTARGVGNAGNVNITTGSFFVREGAILASQTLGQRGDAGDININARDTVSFDVGSPITSVGRGIVGNAGDINITTGSLEVTNGAQVSTETNGQGNAGDININARDTVSFDGVGRNRLNGRSSGALSNVLRNSMGNAGSIKISARSIRLDNKAVINADTRTGQGSIFLNSQDLVLRGGSNIRTNALGTAAGGNITIDTDVIVALENSDISANAQEASGGRVRISAQGIFGTEFRNQRTPLSDITASSNLGPEFSGTVEINNPDVDPTQGLVELPAELVDASNQIATGCPDAVWRGESKFIITGRGGLPPSPTEPLRGDNTLTNWSTLEEPDGENRSSATPATNSTIETAPTTIVEANGWVKGPNGEVTLVATAPTANIDIPWLPKSSCNAPEPES